MLQCKTWVIGVILLLVAILPAHADNRPFTGHWREKIDTGSSPVSIIQTGEILFLFSAQGWGLIEIESGSAGLLASGRGRWAFGSEGAQTNVTIRVGVADNALYLIIAPSDLDARQEILKKLFVRTNPDLPRRKT